MRSLLLFIAVMPLLMLAACSDPQNAPTAVNEKVSVHEPGWMIPTAPSFHGALLAAKKFDASECRQCHGSQFDGGISEISCKKCHTSYPHPVGWAAAHSGFIKSNNYDLISCQPCHGQNYGTQKINNSCLTCHTQQGGPEACNTCHGNSAGDAADLKTAMPPRGLDGETSSTTPAVGAHQAHFVYFANLPAAAVCQECHALPQNFVALGHIDADGRAEAIFNGSLGALKTENGARVPNGSYNAANNTCANNYCHGNWGLLKAKSEYAFIYTVDKMEGGVATPKWTDAQTVSCGTCHDLPPAGHNKGNPPFTLNDCGTCHRGVMDALGKIIDNTKHMNGKVNVFLREYPMF
jgi:predicted CxxxxCH...CXXCH cytochrome family protein